MQSAFCTRWKWEQDKVEDEQGEGVATGRTQVIRLMNAPKSKMRKIEKAQRKEKRRGVRERERAKVEWWRWKWTWIWSAMTATGVKSE